MYLVTNLESNNLKKYRRRTLFDFQFWQRGCLFPVKNFGKELELLSWLFSYLHETIIWIILDAWLSFNVLSSSTKSWRKVIFCFTQVTDWVGKEFRLIHINWKRKRLKWVEIIFLPKFWDCFLRRWLEFWRLLKWFI